MKTKGLVRSKKTMQSKKTPIAQINGISPGFEPDQDMTASYRWVWYLLSLFVPFSGFLIALFLYDRDSREVRKVGRNCLLIAFLFWVVLPLAFLFILFLFSAMAIAGWVTDMMGQAD